MIRQFRDLLVDMRVKFPLTKNEVGFFDAIYTEQGHNLRCPHCGSTGWAVKNYQHIECLACKKQFSNLGVLGLEELDPQHKY
jgi:hypothetical protein